MLGALVTNPHFVAIVDEELREPLPKWDGAPILELAAARWKGGDLLLEKLVAAISGSSDTYGTWMTAAKLLSRHFTGREDVWLKIHAALKARKHFGIPRGVIGHLALGWPAELASLRACVPDNSPLDDLIFWSLDGDSTLASEALAAIVHTHHPHFWRYLSVGQSLLLEWAALPVARTILIELALDDNATRSLLAVKILSRVGARSALPLAGLKSRFNDELSGAHPQREGFDVFTGRYTSWISGVFGTLHGATPTETALHGGYTE